MLIWQLSTDHGKTNTFRNAILNNVDADNDKASWAEYYSENNKEGPDTEYNIIYDYLL